MHGPAATLSSGSQTWPIRDQGKTGDAPRPTKPCSGLTSVARAGAIPAPTDRKETHLITMFLVALFILRARDGLIEQWLLVF